MSYEIHGKDEVMSRRKFFGGCLLASGAVAVGVGGFVVFKYLEPIIGKGEGKRVEIPVTEVPVGKSKIVVLKGQPTMVIHVKGGLFRAFSMKCPHLGCLVKWEENKQEFLCPCHAGRFDSLGKVISGPPPRALDSFPVSVSEGKIIVEGV